MDKVPTWVEKYNMSSNVPFTTCGWNIIIWNSCFSSSKSYICQKLDLRLGNTKQHEMCG